MPPPRRKPTRSSKKKAKGNRQVGDANSSSSAAPVALPSGGDKSGINVTAWHESAASPSQDVKATSLYDIYKAATSRFNRSLANLCPPSFFDPGTVQQLVDAADYLRESAITIPRTLVKDLAIAIKIRVKVARMYNDNEPKHAYFIQTLRYCYMMLRPLASDEGTDSSDLRESVSLGNRFEALSSMEEEDDDAELELPSVLSDRPVEPPESSYLITEDLINGSERFRACLFLEDINELAGWITTQFRTFKKLLRDFRPNFKLDNYAAPVLMEDIMEVVVACNMATQHVDHLESKFILENPKLSNIYRIVALVALPRLVEEMNDIILHKSPIRNQIAESELIGFIGDCVEASFRNPSDPHNRKQELIKTHAERFQVDPDELSKFIDGLQILVHAEVPLGPELKKFQLFGLQPHSWLSAWPNISGKMSLLHTQRLLQGIIPVFRKETKLTLKRGFFGPQWDENKKKAKQIPFDLDEYLMGDVLPDLLSACSRGLLISGKLPREYELMPLFSMLKKMLKNVDKPVPLALSFAVQTLLVGVFELQGDGDVEFIAKSAKRSFDLFKEQVDRSLVDSLPRPPTWRQNHKMLQALLSYLTKPMGSNEFENRSFWNPLCAGTFLSYITYFVNLEGGCAMIDSVGQLRITLHLYNAAKERKLLGSGNIYMETLFDAFKNCKAVWEGPLPKQGEFSKRFLISFGYSLLDARNFSQNLSSWHAHQRAPTGRKLSPIEPEDVSKSFRQICLRDYSKVEDLYHDITIRNTSSLYEFAVRMNDTLDSLEREQKIISLNFISSGAALNQFVYSLANILKWRPLIDSSFQSIPSTDRGPVRLVGGRLVNADSWFNSKESFDAYATAMMVGAQLLTEFDKPGIISGESIATGASMWIEEFFQRLDPKNFLFFTPSETEDTTSENAVLHTTARRC